MIKEKIGDRITLNISKSEKFKTNFLSFFFSVPLENEYAAEYALVPKVLLRGSRNYPDMQAVNKRLDYLYGAHVTATVFKRGERQVTGVFSSCLCNEYAFEKTDILKNLISVVKDLFFNPLTENGAFKEAYVEGEKKNQIDFIKSQINNKNQYALKRCQQIMCADEAYGISENGTADQVEGITPDSLYKAYERFISCADIDVFFVGKCDEKQLKTDICDMFADISRQNVAPFEPNIIKDVKEVKNEEEVMNITQGKLTLGFRTGISVYDSSYTAFSLFNEIFGGSPSSKLFMNVREKLSLCYYCSAIPEAHKGLLFVASGIEVENKQKAQEEILNQLEDIKLGKISDEEFDSAVKSLVNGYSELDDDPQSLSLWYYGRMLAGLDGTPQDVCEKIKALTKADVVNAASGIKLDTVYFLKGAKA